MILAARDESSTGMMHSAAALAGFQGERARPKEQTEEGRGTKRGTSIVVYKLVGKY